MCWLLFYTILFTPVSDSFTPSIPDPSRHGFSIEHYQATIKFFGYTVAGATDPETDGYANSLERFVSGSSPEEGLMYNTLLFQLAVLFVMSQLLLFGFRRVNQGRPTSSGSDHNARLAWLKLQIEVERERQERLRLAHELENAKVLLSNYIGSFLEKQSELELYRKEIEQLKLVAGTALHDQKYEIIQKLKQSIILTDEDWVRFRRLFDNVHRDFIYKVRLRYGGLTDGDIRLITLLKLELTGKEMASMLGISTEAVRKSKQRLRKKLDISSDSELVQILRDI